MQPDFRTKPFAHQLAEFEGHRGDAVRRNNWEQGCGKSKDTIDSACSLFAEGRLDGVLVMAPGGVHRNWVEEQLPAHLWPSLERRTVGFAYQTGKFTTQRHKRALDEFLRHDGLAVLAMSYDAYMTDRGRQAATKFMGNRRVMAVLDEAGEVANPAARRTQSVIRTSWRAEFKRTLDGTPVRNGPFEVYAPTKFLQPDFWVKRGLSTYAEFKAHFGVWEKDGYWNPNMRDPLTGQFGCMVPALRGYRRLDELREMLAPITTRVTKEQCLDLPRKMYRKRAVELNPEQRRVYQELSDQYFADLSDGRVVSAPMALVRLLRLQQVVCGYVPVEVDEPAHVLPGTNHRLEALRAELAQCSGKAIVWARFRLDLDLISAALKEDGRSFVRYDGTLDQCQRDANADAFKASADSGPQFMLATQAAAYRGHTWTVARGAHFYSNSFKLDHRTQSEDRCHRIGTEWPVDYCDYVAHGTCDDKLIRALRAKQDVADQVNGDNYKNWI